MNVPTSTVPNANIDGFANAVIRLIATTVPGRAHGSIMRISMAAFPRKRILAMTYAETRPRSVAPPTAIALISRLFVIASHDRGFVNKLTKFSVVYREGKGAARHEPFTEKAKMKIMTIGSIKKMVEPVATRTQMNFHTGLVTCVRFRPPPFDG